MSKSKNKTNLNGTDDEDSPADVRVLRTGGAFAFTVETLDSGDFALRDTCHHAHGEGYIRQLAAENHLDVVLCKRIDNMRFGIKGTLFWLEKAD